MPLDLILTIIGSAIFLFGMMAINVWIWHKEDNDDNKTKQ